MNVVFMGTPEFARANLAALCNSNHRVVAVVTGADKPVGRRRRLSPTVVRTEAEKHGLPVLMPESLKIPALRDQLSAFEADLFVVAAFRILPESLFALPRFGSINVHASLLPKYRGAAPINWALINGETETGLTSFYLKKKVDTGDLILQQKIRIADNDTFDTLHARLCELTGPFLLKTLDLVEKGEATAIAQSDSEATAAPKIHPAEAEIDFSQPAFRVRNFVRGMATRPGAYTYFRGNKLKVHACAVAEGVSVDRLPLGAVVPGQKRLLVRCGEGVLELLKVVPAGRKEMDGSSFVNGFRPQAGEVLAKSDEGAQEQK